jgi:RNA-splicing ligase RtcB
MPDTHRGAGSVIGFTMPIGERVVPNVVGVDIGCGLLATRLDDTLAELGLDHDTVDQQIRDTVPMGWGREGVRAPDREYYHLVDDFPWERVND